VAENDHNMRLPSFIVLTLRLSLSLIASTALALTDSIDQEILTTKPGVLHRFTVRGTQELDEVLELANVG
jgi:hypothetical protein